MITTAPLYAGKRVRTHNTSIGRILCTGKGCIGCNAKRFKHKNLQNVLGDVDTADFGKKKTEFDTRYGDLSRRRTADGCYGNDQNGSRAKRVGGTGRSGSLGADRVVKKNGGKGRVNSQQRLQRGEAVFVDEGDGNVPPPSSNLLPGRSGGSQNPRMPDQNGKYFIKEKAWSNMKNSGMGTGHVRTRFNLQGQKVFQSRKDLPKSQTNFLQMLQQSEAGIYDVTTMEERKASSFWVAKILQMGSCSEKELLPRIPSAKIARMGASLNFKQDNKERAKMAANVPRIILNDRFLYEGDDTVVVIEPSEDGDRAQDGTLYQLAFAAECSSVRRSIPRFSVLDIAEGLSERVKMESVKFIQRKGKQWRVLVSGHCVRDFLIQRGIVVKGRRLRMVETAGQ